MWDLERRDAFFAELRRTLRLGLAALRADELERRRELDRDPEAVRRWGCPFPLCPLVLPSARR